MDHESAVIATLLPPEAGTELAAAEWFGDPPAAQLFPAEEVAVARAVEKRRREYATVRHCARSALGRLGFAAAPILTGPDREPLWPAGVVGSMTHCDGYRAAVVARSSVLAAVGIDAEPNAALPEGVLQSVARAEELPHLAQLAATDPGTHWDRLLFSAKESVYKAWFPLARRWLGFEEATLRFDPARRAFTAALHQTGPLVAGQPLTAMRGRWLVHDGFVITAITVAATAGVPSAIG